MGIVDVKMDVMRESQWKKWQRRRNISNPQQQKPDHSNSASPAVAEVGSDESMEHELYWAAARSSLAEFNSILESVLARRDPNESLNDVVRRVSPLGNTLLHVAAAHGNSSLLARIASLSASLILSRNRDGDTPLHLAAEAGHATAVTELLSGSCPMVKNGQGNTALHEALIRSNEAAAGILARQDPVAMLCLNNEEKSGFYLAAESEYHVSRCLRILIEKCPNFVQSRDEAGMTPLHLAAITGYMNGVAYLLTKFPPATVVKDGSGFFPIHWAAKQGRVDIVETLLKHSPDPVELLDSKRRNILHVAAECGRTNVVVYILKNVECRKLINARDDDGNTPLHLATMNWHPRIISALTAPPMVLIALRLGLPLLGVSLTMMSVGFMAGVYVVVSNLHWLAHGVIIMGTMFFVPLAALTFPLCLPISSDVLILRYVSYYPFLLLMYVTNSGTTSQARP
uniref:Uncharacterized protein n=1 Tax=Kalanchoe fedtschenkoi TaxID=63787 RepID=A0A7N0UFE0_KALFE